MCKALRARKPASLDELGKTPNQVDREGPENPAKEKPPRGAAAAQYIQKGDLIGQFKAVKMIGGGGCGQIYKMVDPKDGQVAVGKIEPPGATIRMECQVLLLMNARPHFPKLYASGEHGEFNFIIMELLGENLNDLRKRLLNKRMSVTSTFKLGIQLTDAFEELHRKGFVHRDIKPSNMCMGHADHGCTVYLVDFGLARRFMNEKGIFRLPREKVKFCGTSRYASIRADQLYEQRPADDLMSLYYTLIELCEGALPWRLINEHDDILAQKQRYDFQKLAVYTPAVMQQFYDYISDLAYDELPNYDKIRDIYQQCFPITIRPEDPFDWYD